MLHIKLFKHLYFVIITFLLSNHQIYADEYTFRYLSGEGPGRGKSKQSDTYTYTSVEIYHLKFENWGFGIGKYSGTGCRDNDVSGVYMQCNNTLTDRPWYDGYVNAINYSYTFGDRIFLTLMRNIYAQGEVINLHADNGNELEMNEVAFSYHNFSLPILVHQFQLGFRISNLEFIIASDFSTFYFKKDNGYCFENSEGVEECSKNKVIFNAGGVTLVGLGIVF